MRTGGRIVFWMAAAILAGAQPGEADTIYRTEFEAFTVGENTLVGTEGWAGNSTASGSHGIDLDIVPGAGLGNTAFIGFKPPTGTTNPVLIFRPVNLNPATNSEPVIEFESFLGIEDSSNDFRDDFWISFYSISGSRLAAIRFQNDAFTSWIYRSDGMGQFNTGASFIPGELHLLYVRLDLNINKWSAFLDDIPLFNGAPFTSLAATRTLGSVGVDWRRGPRPMGVTTWGDNWMLIADWEVRTVPFALNSHVRNPNGSFTLTWTGDPGRSYQVQHSATATGWLGTLPGSTYPTQSVLSTMSFTNVGPLPEKLFYRVVRTP
jgi:hypothetical protein